MDRHVEEQPPVILQRGRRKKRPKEKKILSEFKPFYTELHRKHKYFYSNLLGAHKKPVKKSIDRETIFASR